MGRDFTKAGGAARGKRSILVMAGAFLCGLTSWAAPATSIGDGSITVRIEPGKSWLHRFSAFKVNAPQFALWIEDEAGSYVKTLYATRKIATEGWVFNKGNRRKEALPRWCHRRGVRYPDGLFLPAKDQPLVDALTSASPGGSFDLSFDPPAGLRRFLVYFEVNHSTDFNAAYPKDAVQGTPGWSGGPGGSGQPALVYRLRVDLDARRIGSSVELLGHASPDGSDGNLHSDVSGLTSALGILGSMEALANR